MSGPAEYADYKADEDVLYDFFREYREENDDMMETFKYAELLQKVKNRASRVVEVDLDDINDWERAGPELCERIRTNARRYVDIISRAIDRVLLALRATDFSRHDGAADVMRNLREDKRDRARAERAANGEGDDGAAQVEDDEFPPALTRRYQVVLLAREGDKSVPLRRVLSAHIGSLLTVKGIVTRVTAVKPQLQVATYTCDQCGFEVYQEVTARNFMPLFKCPSSNCEHNRTNGKLRMQTRGSVFVPFQEVRLQEEADQVPVGHIPRAITIHAYGESARKCSAGDVVSVTGVFLPVPYEGQRGLRAGLIADTFVEAASITQHKKSHTDEAAAAEMAAQVADIAADGNVYEKLGRSIAPEIFAHDDVKKALLLLLVGGVTNTTSDGMRIRGDINVCLMGDPGVAKSQLLKHVSHIAPRSVYTTGKGSSGVGLTAAVTRDTQTGEAVLEGGALVLADMGVCCIDEFDKMEDADRTAIHEVMEQQTVSIAKAGITTTLNARTSVLAAANHAWSRYNPSKSVSENINMPAALLSRFDLMWLIRDKPDLARDLALAEHVTYVHRHSSHPPMDFEALDAKTVRAYVCAAKRYSPAVPPELTEHIVDEYVALRQKDALDPSKTECFTSARTLLAILRLAQALARLRFSDKVGEEDVAEARRLMEMSKESVHGGRDEKEGLSAQEMVTRVAEIINEQMIANGGDSIAIADVMPQLISSIGATAADVNRTIDEYTDLGVWMRIGRDSVKLVDPAVDDE